MGNPLVSIAAELFTRRIKNLLDSKIKGRSSRARQVDDIVMLCDRRSELTPLKQIDTIHLNLAVARIYETNGCSPFFNVFIDRREDGSIEQSVHRNST